MTGQIQYAHTIILLNIPILAYHIRWLYFTGSFAHSPSCPSPSLENIDHNAQRVNPISIEQIQNKFPRLQSTNGVYELIKGWP